MLIKNGRIIDPANGVDEVNDLLIEDGKVVSIGKVENYDGETYDAAGKIVAPGFVDLHCHLRDPGFEYKEDIYTGTRAAAHGGFTSVCCMANTMPVNDNAAITRSIIEKAHREGVVNVYPIGAITKGLKGEELAEMGQMQKAGTVAVSDDGKPVMSGRKMYLALPVVGFQIVSANFFQAIGKPAQAAFLSLSRQIIFLIPALLLLPLAFGLNGILFSVPVADLLSSLITSVFVAFEIRRLRRGILKV